MRDIIVCVRVCVCARMCVCHMFNISSVITLSKKITLIWVSQVCNTPATTQNTLPHTLPAIITLCDELVPLALLDEGDDTGKSLLTGHLQVVKFH